MGSSVLYMSMSLDGFVTGPDDGPGSGLGVGGERLHAWLGEWTGRPTGFDPPGASGVVFRELMATGAVVVGRKTFDYARPLEAPGVTHLHYRVVRSHGGHLEEER